MKPIAQIATALVIILGTGAATVTVLNEDVPDLAVPAGPWAPGSDLDGRTFYTVDVVEENGDILRDELVFQNGQFQSVMCQQYCDFGWSGYDTCTEGEVIHFTAKTVCPDAPHTVVFYGTVTGDSMELVATWTTRRWYWTQQLNITGSGTTEPLADEALQG